MTAWHEHGHEKEGLPANPVVRGLDDAKSRLKPLAIDARCRNPVAFGEPEHHGRAVELLAGRQDGRMLDARSHIRRWRNAGLDEPKGLVARNGIMGGEVECLSSRFALDAGEAHVHLPRIPERSAPRRRNDRALGGR